jgi:hypothetical protein
MKNPEKGMLGEQFIWSTEFSGYGLVQGKEGVNLVVYRWSSELWNNGMGGSGYVTWTLPELERYMERKGEKADSLMKDAYQHVQDFLKQGGFKPGAQEHNRPAP